MKFWYAFLFAHVAFANPVGEEVVGGDVSFSRPSNHELHVLQKSDRAVVEWDQFSIDADEVTRFIQPGKDSVVLNRVTGGDVSFLYGRLEANGQVILMNPHGVIVGESGVIDARAFLPILHDIDARGFMDGMPQFPSIDAAAVVNREGCVEADCVERVGDRVFLVSSAANLGDVLGTVISPSSVAPSAAQVVQNSQEALQELRTLIPERLWVQEFSILLDREAFVAQIQSLIDHHRRNDMMRSSFALARSRDYLLPSTMAGENIRLLDHYQEFEQSPFWRTPNQLNRLRWLER